MVKLLQVVPSDVKAQVFELMASGLPTTHDTLEQLAVKHGLLVPGPPIEWAGTQTTKSDKVRCSKADRNDRKQAWLIRRLTSGLDGEDMDKVERAIANQASSLDAPLQRRPSLEATPSSGDSPGGGCGETGARLEGAGPLLHEGANAKGAPNEAPSSAPHKGEPNKAPVEAPPEGEANEAPAGAPPEGEPEEAPPVGKKTLGKNTAPTIWKKLEVLRFMDCLEPPPDVRRWQRIRLVMNRFPETVKNKSQLTRWQQARTRDHWDSLPPNVARKHKELPNVLRTRVLHRCAKGSRGVSLPDEVLEELDRVLVLRVHGLGKGLRPQEAILSRTIAHTTKKIVERYNARVLKVNQMIKQHNTRLLERVTEGKMPAARATGLAQDPKKCLTPFCHRKHLST